MNKYIAIYVRRSVSDKEKGNNSLSIPAQIADCIKFVGEDAFYKVYEEDGKSGKDIKHRPAFMRMFEDCREGLVSKIVVKKYDRFSRNIFRDCSQSVGRYFSRIQYNRNIFICKCPDTFFIEALVADYTSQRYIYNRIFHHFVRNMYVRF